MFAYGKPADATLSGEVARPDSNEAAQAWFHSLVQFVQPKCYGYPDSFRLFEGSMTLRLFFSFFCDASPSTGGLEDSDSVKQLGWLMVSLLSIFVF